MGNLCYQHVKDALSFAAKWNISLFKELRGTRMLYSQMVSPAVRQAVLEQMKKGGYKLPSLEAFNIESFGTVSHVIYAGNM
jgi:sialic acid synthase SpsE